MKLLADARDLVEMAASLEPARVDRLGRLLRATIDGIARVARTLRIAWLGLLLCTAMTAAAALVTMWRADGRWSTFGVVLALCAGVALLLNAALLALLHRAAGLPGTVDALTETAVTAIGQTRADYVAIRAQAGWRASLRTLWAAGRLVRTLLHASDEHGSATHAGTIAILFLLSPPGWIAMLALATFELAITVVGASYAIARGIAG